MQCPNGKWRIGNGECVFNSKESAERAWHGYQMQKLSFGDIRRRVGMLVTNFVQKVWSSTQGEYLKGVEEQSPAQVKYEWLTVGDDRTCPICEPKNGQMFFEMDDVMKEYPPHANCRCWIEVRKVMPIRPMQRFQWTPPEGW